MNERRLLLPIAAILAFTLASCASAPEKPAPGTEPPSGVRARGEAAAVKVSLSVLAVDLDQRRITLEGPQGNTGIYTVSEQVKRLSEIHAGDKIAVDYKVVALAELRNPTEAEKIAPLVLTEGAERAGAQEPPGCAFTRTLKLVVILGAIDKPAKSFTLQGPLGGRVTVQVGDERAFESLRVGQAIVATFVESLVLNVEPGVKKP